MHRSRIGRFAKCRVQRFDGQSFFNAEDFLQQYDVQYDMHLECVV
jgi:hypothetical protein